MNEVVGVPMPMDVTVSKEELAQLLGKIQSVVAKKTTMPILANVLITASKNELKIAGSDLEITAVSSATANVTTPGSTTISAKVFGDIVRELPDSDVSLRVTEGERLEIKALKSKFRVIGSSAEEYPSLPAIGFDVRNKLPTAQLLEMIQKTLYAVSLDETRFNLNGVCFEVLREGSGASMKRSLRMVATDGHRLAIITRPCGELEFEGRVIVPRKGLAEIRHILETESSSEVGIDIREGFLLVECANTKVSMRLIDGEYPNYDQVLPKGKGTLATLNASDLSQAIRRAALVVTDRGKCVRVDFQKDLLRISSSSPELGDAVEEFGLKYQGAPTSIGFNALYLLDIASSLSENQQLNVEIHGELGAAKFFADGDESYIGVVMPMRLK